jgi:hypothetical protein
VCRIAPLGRFEALRAARARGERITLAKPTTSQVFRHTVLGEEARECSPVDVDGDRLGLGKPKPADLVDCDVGELRDALDFGVGADVSRERLSLRLDRGEKLRLPLPAPALGCVRHPGEHR